MDIVSHACKDILRFHMNDLFFLKFGEYSPLPGCEALLSDWFSLVAQSWITQN